MTERPAFEDLAALPCGEPDAKAVDRIDRATQRWRTTTLRPHFEAAGTTLASANPRQTHKNFVQPSDVLRHELKLARSTLDSTTLDASQRGALAETLAGIEHAAFRGRVFLGGASSISGRDSRRRPIWDIACWPQTETGQPDPEKYATILSHAEAVSENISAAHAAFTAARDTHLGDAKNRVLLGNVLHHLDSINLLMQQSTTLIQSNYRADTRGR